MTLWAHRDELGSVALDTLPAPARLGGCSRRLRLPGSGAPPAGTLPRRRPTAGTQARGDCTRVRRGPLSARDRSNRPNDATGRAAESSSQRSAIGRARRRRRAASRLARSRARRANSRRHGPPLSGACGTGTAAGRARSSRAEPPRDRVDAASTAPRYRSRPGPALRNPCTAHGSHRTASGARGSSEGSREASATVVRFSNFV